MPSTPLGSAALALLLVTLWVSVPPARADQVAGTTLMVGQNVFQQPGLAASQNGPACLKCVTDGNYSSWSSISWNGNNRDVTGTCQSSQNFTIGVPTSRAVRADTFHIRFDIPNYNYNNPCIQWGLTLENGGAPALTMATWAQGSVNDYWLNFTEPVSNVTGIWWRWSDNCGACGNFNTLQALVYELELFSKNTTTYPMLQAMVDQAATNLQCLPGSAASTNYASNTLTIPQGTFYVLVPSLINTTTGYADVMQVTSPYSTLTSTLAAWSKTLPDVPGSRNGAVVALKVVTTQPGVIAMIRPESGNVASTQAVCRFERLDALFSSTLTNGYIKAPLNAWGGTSLDTWGIVYDTKAYPINSLYDSDLTGTSSLFDQENMTSGIQLFPTGADGQSATLNLATIPYAWAGNGFFIALGQSSTANGDSAHFALKVNGYPAQAISNGVSTSRAFEYAVFYVDDVAARNNLSNANGSVGNGNARPFGAESYELTLAGGFDPAAPVYLGLTSGRDGHAGLACRTICATNVNVQNLVLPQRQSNALDFLVTDAGGNPIPDARVLYTNTTTSQLTNPGGQTWFNNTFQNAHFTIAKSGYVTLCADYFFKNSPGFESGTTPAGCGYVKALNASFTISMMTLQQAGLGGNGSVLVGGPSTPNQAITFDGNTTRIIPDRVNINITRAVSAALFVGADHVDSSTGAVQHNVVRATYWEPATSNTFAFYYPTRTHSGPQDRGLYILWVMNDTGNVLAYTKYFLEPTGADWHADDAVITSDVIASIQKEGYQSAQQSYQQAFQASILSQQKSVRDQIYDDFQSIHNYGLFFIGLLFFLAIVRAFRR